jgi:molybdopterin/thiamine biosynthesis adenylyltransferase
VTDDQLLRYSRHILLDDIGIDGQERFLAAHALVIGAGGLGSPVALYLGSAGVGQITLVDHDVVDLTNLQRQVAHTVDRLGMPKVASAKAAIAAINPHVQVNALPQQADAALLDVWVPKASVVLDCSDNFATRHLVNAACVRHGVPLVSGAAIRMDAQIALYDTRSAESATRGACYACVFPPGNAPEETRCATMGVFAPLVGIVGTMQAAMALQVINGTASGLGGKLMLLDGASLSVTEVRVGRNPHCPVCGTDSELR